MRGTQDVAIDLFPGERAGDDRGEPGASELTLQWQLHEIPSSPILEGLVVRVSDHASSVDADDEPVRIFLAEDSSGQLHAFLPLFRENDYGMVWFEVRGPIGLQESMSRWKFTDRRLSARGLVRWRIKKLEVFIDGTASAR
jgi:hypothetical protein